MSYTISSLNTEINRLKKQIALLENQLAPSPDHALARDQVIGVFKSDPEWLNRNYALQQEAERIGQDYYNSHVYIEGETDCNDMAVDIWNMLYKQGIKSAIVIGNLDKTGETFDEVNHAWLYIFNADGTYFYMEPTTGEVIFGRTGDGSNPEAEPYRDESSFIYEKPSDLWADLKIQLW